jgi:hypothetical protein
MVRFDNLPICCVQQDEQDVGQTQIPSCEAAAEEIRCTKLHNYISQMIARFSQQASVCSFAQTRLTVMQQQASPTLERSKVSMSRFNKGSAAQFRPRREQRLTRATCSSSQPKPDKTGPT